MESTSTGFVTFPLSNGLLYSDDDGQFRTLAHAIPTPL